MFLCLQTSANESMFYSASVCLSLFLSVLMAFSRWIRVSLYQNVSILDFIGARDDGGGDDNLNYKTCKAAVKSSQPINQYPVFAGRMRQMLFLPVTQPSVSEH